MGFCSEVVLLKPLYTRPVMTNHHEVPCMYPHSGDMHVISDSRIKSSIFRKLLVGWSIQVQQRASKSHSIHFPQNNHNWIWPIFIVNIFLKLIVSATIRKMFQIILLRIVSLNLFKFPCLCGLIFFFIEYVM